MDATELYLLKQRLGLFEDEDSTPQHEEDLKTLLAYVTELEAKLKVYEDREVWQATVESGRAKWNGPLCAVCKRVPCTSGEWCDGCMNDQG